MIGSGQRKVGDIAYETGLSVFNAARGLSRVLAIYPHWIIENFLPRETVPGRRF